MGERRGEKQLLQRCSSKGTPAINQANATLFQYSTLIRSLADRSFVQKPSAPKLTESDVSSSDFNEFDFTVENDSRNMHRNSISCILM
jgi:hypothetical protein